MKHRISFADTRRARIKFRSVFSGGRDRGTAKHVSRNWMHFFFKTGDRSSSIGTSGDIIYYIDIPYNGKLLVDTILWGLSCEYLDRLFIVDPHLIDRLGSIAQKMHCHSLVEQSASQELMWEGSLFACASACHTHIPWSLPYCRYQAFTRL